MKEQGKCPYCGSEDIEYGSMELKDDNIVDYPCHCNKCNKDFTEGYHLEFDGMFDEDGEELENAD